MVSIYWTLGGGATVMADPLPLEQSLSLAEQVYFQNLHFPRRRADWLLGRWVAKCLLRAADERLRDYALRRISVLRNAQGAPQVWVTPDTPYPVALSLTHREGWAACALAPAPDLMLGIDLECIEPRASAFVADYFTAEERAYVQSLPETNLSLAVTLIWSLKEAVLKALRVGLAWDTRRVNVDLPVSLTPNPSWQAARVSVRGIAAPWWAWWCVLGQKVLTLAVCADESPTDLAYVPIGYPARMRQSIGC